MSNDHDAILAAVRAEIERATARWPGWPDDPVHAAAIVAEEAGELVQASIDFSYSLPDCAITGRNRRRVAYANMRTEAIQTAAMAIRFLRGMDDYERRPSPGVQQ